MERTKKPNEVISDKPWWQKVGGGSLRMGNNIIKPGQKFQAFPEDISESFRKFVVPLSTGATFKPLRVKEDINEASQVKAEKSVFTKQPHGKSLFLFDVVDTKGKVINEKSLKEDAADSMLEALNK